MIKLLKTKVAVCILLIAFCVPLPVCTQTVPSDSKPLIQVTKIILSEKKDTLKVDFKIMRDGSKMPFKNMSAQDAKSIINVYEMGSPAKTQPQVESLLDIRGCNSMSDSLSVLVLVDASQSVSDKFKMEQEELVYKIIELLPDSCVYLAAMYEDTTTITQRADKKTFENSIRGEFLRVSRGGKKIFQSILTKYEELNTDKNYKGEKWLIVISDGDVENEMNDMPRYINVQNSINQLRENGKIPIFCISVFDTNELNEPQKQIMKYIGKITSERGGFLPTPSPNSLQEKIQVVYDSMSADYRLVMVNPKGKIYDGSLLSLKLSIIGFDGSDSIYGVYSYCYGSREKPYIVGQQQWNVILWGLLMGLLLLFATYYFLKYLEPSLYNKWTEKKFIHRYAEIKDDDTGISCCYVDKQAFNDDDEVVHKCKHLMHKDCWKERNCLCPECKDKVYRYYNQKNKRDPKNATTYFKWIIGGFVAGLAAWLLFQALSEMGLFSSLMGNVVKKIQPSMESTNLANKTAVWLQCGTCLGFFVIMVFSYVLEFREKNLSVVGKIAVKSLIGSFLGFVSFLLGAIIVILLSVEKSDWRTDWIPWLFFALTISVVLWYKTEIALKSALIGGCISVLFSFIVMFAISQPTISMFCFMVYAAGLGCSIAVVHHIAGSSFLRISGCTKERDIAIYKWMTASGGFNKVSIGKSPKCVIPMDWDKSDNIKDRVVEIYLENKIPFCRVLDEGMTKEGRSVKKGATIMLVDGYKFNIGKTQFEYIEKEPNVKLKK